MILQPDFITEMDISVAIEQVRAKKNPKAINSLRFAPYEEGRCAQIMHIGPFSEEGTTMEKLTEFIASISCKVNGIHHEIYLSDIRRAAPGNWKTILRLPIR